MSFTREDYIEFLETEYKTQMKEYGRLIATKASVLKERGEVFVGKFVGFKDEFAIFKVRISDNMPRKNSFWTASCFIGEMGSYRNWGDLSWETLRESYQSEYSEANCVWLSKSDNPEFCLVGIKHITVQMAELLEEQKPIIAFGPKEPPLKYISNLISLVKRKDIEYQNDILNYQTVEESVWNPHLVSNSDDLNMLLLNKLDNNDTIAIQGPPGTGKTYRMANLISRLLEEGKSVLVTSLTNEALNVIAKEKDLSSFLDGGKVSKTSLTIDEKKLLPKLKANVDNVCDAAPGYLSLATFYVSSGWAKNIVKTRPYNYVIIDEASQALLPMIAACKILGEKVIWIGDQKQLAPIVQLNEDIINKKGWFPIVKGFDTICNNVKMPTFMLTDSYRLSKRAAEFTGIFYDNKLNSIAEVLDTPVSIPEINPLGGPSLLDLELPIGDKKPDVALDAIFKLTKDILDRNPQAKIAILAKFKETIRELQKKFTTELNVDEIPDNIKIETVDRIQGITVDYTIFFIPNATVGYSLEDEFFNVATSRAKIGTIIVTDKHIIKNFMSDYVRRYLLKIHENKVATLDLSTNKTITAGDIKVTILGKIDIPEKKLKEIVDGKENIFIVDTNVFVKCPSIISRIGKYKVIIPTTVLEELDHLKLKENIDKKALSDAIKNINNSFLRNYSNMDEGDVSLLPQGFDIKKADCIILSVALKYKQEDKNPILLTSDNLLQSKALGLGISTISLKDFLEERRH